MHISHHSRLTRTEASAYLREKHGVSRAPSTLAKLACYGEGPDMVYVGKTPFYEPHALDAFVRSLIKRAHSTRERPYASSRPREG